ncbi:MAG: DUF4062 domain-containing protein [Planctomycetaceae bacterium]|nr:DUF4062 domain-containing protein [Planctomycetales bacterium]MCB9924255.1 DUF4062 domain-containing protein [Planctomycetaceae bacterium]
MDNRWQDALIFISSTFRDMHAERDYLIKRVFPELRQRLEKHRIHLVDVDLRWGVTKEQADNDEVLDVCLQQIEKCTPFFVGILGERYGWVPHQYPVNAVSKYGWIQHHTGKSVTELEVVHGVLNEPRMHDHAFFYFRDPKVSQELPEELRQVFEESPTEDELNKLSIDEAQRCADQRRASLAELKDRIRSTEPAVQVVERYPCDFQGLRINRRIARMELDEADQHTLEQVAQDGIVDLNEYSQLDETLRRFVTKHGVVYLTGLEEFGRQVRDQLWQAIQERFNLASDTTEESETADPSQRETDYHERFMESRIRVYVGRTNLLHDLADYATGSATHPCLVTGGPGSGKSAALVKFIAEYRASNSKSEVLAHFVGASPQSTNLRNVLRRLCAFAAQQANIDDEIPQDMNELTTKLRDWINQIPTDRRTIIVIDALNQLDDSDNAHLLYWLPRELPPHVKIIVSCIDDNVVGSLREPNSAPDVTVDRSRSERTTLDAFEHRPKEHIEIKPLTDDERKDIVREVPSLSAKTLDPKQVDLLLSNPATTNPLFLLVALEELRGFGSFEQLNERIEHFPRDGDTVTAIFDQVIDRLEEDFDTTLVRQVLSLLASARRGLSERELQELTASLDEADDLFPVLRQVRPYLQARGELLDFYHRSFFKAVRTRYLATSEPRSMAHTQLANYFRGQDYFRESLEEQRARAKRLPPTPRPVNIRKVDELPFHVLEIAKLADPESNQPEAPEWDVVADLLTDWQFLEAKAEAQP